MAEGEGLEVCPIQNIEIILPRTGAIKPTPRAKFENILDILSPDLLIKTIM